MDDDETITLAEAKIWLRARMEEGENCPCCGQLAKIYTRKLNSAMARDLIWLVRMSYVTGGEGWVDLSTGPKALHVSRELAKLVYWSLIEMKMEPSLKGARTSGIWRPTDQGIKFARGRIALPSHIRLYDSSLLGFTGDPTNIRQALGDHFNYEELWGGTPFAGFTA
jgi:hypothetical protein